MDEFKTILKSKIMDWLNMKKVETVKLSQSTLKDGTTVTYDKLEIGGHFLIKNQSDTAVPAPAGEYTLMDGTVVTIGEDNLITNLVPGSTGSTPSGSAKSPKEPESENMIPQEVTDLMARVAILEEAINKLIESQESMKSELSVQNEDLKKQIIELSATPMSIPFVLSKVEKEKEKTLFEKRVEFLNKNKK